MLPTTFIQKAPVSSTANYRPRDHSWSMSLPHVARGQMSIIITFTLEVIVFQFILIFCTTVIFIYSIDYKISIHAFTFLYQLQNCQNRI